MNCGLPGEGALGKAPVRLRSGPWVLPGRHGTRNARWDAVVFYIFLVAALNLGLGFGVAVYLGRRYRGVFGDGGPWDTGTPRDSSIDEVLASDQKLAAGARRLSVGPAEAQPREATGATAADEATGGKPGPQPDPTEPSPQPEKSPRERSVENISSEVQQYHEHVAGADQELRACAEDPDAVQIGAILGSLKDSTAQYLEGRNRVHGTFKLLNQGRPEANEVCDEVQAAFEREDRQIEGTRAMIEGFDYEGNLGEGCRRMFNETGRLIDSIDQLQGMLDEVKLKLATVEGRPEAVSPTTRSEATAEDTAAAALESELAKWWNQDPDQTTRLSVALIDLDEPKELRKQHGREVAAKVFRAVTELLESAKGGLDELSRLSDQRLVLMSSEPDARLTANTAERLRQTVEKARLRHEQSELRVTVSCAVVGAVSEETPNELIQRAEATLQEARRYGNNRTFLHDGKYPSPVVPPSFSLEEKEVAI